MIEPPAPPRARVHLRPTPGYDSEVGERGVQLSGGQRQRLAISPASCENPRILIFDEATSALGTATRRPVPEATERVMKGRTAFVSPPPLHILNADQILVLEHGGIVQRGTHAELWPGRAVQGACTTSNSRGTGAGRVEFRLYPARFRVE